jgi:hypothetical protein
MTTLVAVGEGSTVGVAVGGSGVAVAVGGSCVGAGGFVSVGGNAVSVAGTDAVPEQADPAIKTKKNPAVINNVFFMMFSCVCPKGSGV